MDFSAKQLFGVIITVLVGGALLLYTTGSGGFNEKMSNKIDNQIDEIINNY